MFKLISICIEMQIKRNRHSAFREITSSVVKSEVLAGNINMSS